MMMLDGTARRYVFKES